VKQSFPVEDLKVVGRRRNWIPGKLAVCVFLLRMSDIWPFNHIWETQ
jgi:hypothetical protein